MNLSEGEDDRLSTVHTRCTETKRKERRKNLIDSKPRTSVVNRKTKMKLFTSFTYVCKIFKYPQLTSALVSFLLLGYEGRCIRPQLARSNPLSLIPTVRVIHHAIQTRIRRKEKAFSAAHFIRKENEFRGWH